MEKEYLNELMTLWEHSSDGFLILDSKATILYSNPAIEQVSGLDQKYLHKKNIRDLLYKGMISDSASLKAIKQRKTVTREFSTLPGKQIISTATPVIDQAGNLSRVICNIRNAFILPWESSGPGNFPPDLPTVWESGVSSCHGITIRGNNATFVYRSRKTKALVELAVRLGQVDSTVLISGETGTGKELVARLIHESSRRVNSGELIKVNCASIPENLIESELFGYEPGAFTGALKSGKPGYIELAHRGTLFLDEIAELPFEMQSKLLGVLQDREVTRIGQTRAKPVDIRIIAATNRDLEQMVAAGKFRKDLFYRLNVIPVKVPPLRERKPDIPVLISYFCNKLKETYQISKQICPEVIDHLFWYPWPGNVRELESLVERLFIVSPQKEITLSCLPDSYCCPANRSGRTLKEQVAQFELELIGEALEQYRTNIEAAEKLGISLSSLGRRLRKLEQKQDE
jgi:PAS domain S-box-containing protein